MHERVDSPRFGTIEYTEAQVLRFPEGLLGFPTLRHFLHLTPDGLAPVQFLLPLERPELAFPVLNPYLVKPDYSFDLTSADQQALGMDEDAEITVYAITTLRRDVTNSTINLLAPVVLHPAKKLGRQVVLETSPHSVAEPLAAAS